MSSTGNKSEHHLQHVSSPRSWLLRYNLLTKHESRPDRSSGPVLARNQIALDVVSWQHNHSRTYFVLIHPLQDTSAHQSITLAWLRKPDAVSKIIHQVALHHAKFINCHTHRNRLFSNMMHSNSNDHGVQDACSVEDASFQLSRIVCKAIL